MRERCVLWREVSLGMNHQRWCPQVLTNSLMVAPPNGYCFLVVGYFPLIGFQIKQTNCQVLCCSDLCRCPASLCPAAEGTSRSGAGSCCPESAACSVSTRSPAQHRDLDTGSANYCANFVLASHTRGRNIDSRAGLLRFAGVSPNGRACPADVPVSSVYS